MNKEQQELLGEAYRNYGFTCIGETKRQEQQMKEKGGWLDLCLTPYFEDKEEFINKCKTDTEFSEKWGLKIEERDLSDKERLNTLTQNEQRLIYERVQSFKNVRRKKLKDFLDEQKIPTKLITITYNDKTIESYE
jgi:hypothetical protein